MEFVQIIKDMKIHKNKGLKQSFKFNFHTRNKTRLCNSKKRTQDVQEKCENGSLLC
jgi:hypothetical protein